MKEETHSQEEKLTVYKRTSISSSHKLDLPYKSNCNQLHGHNYLIEIWLTGKVKETGILVDFNHISEIVRIYDHKHLNDFFEPATVENMVKEIIKQVKMRIDENVDSGKVKVWETENCFAEQSFKRDEEKNERHVKS